MAAGRNHATEAAAADGFMGEKPRDDYGFRYLIYLLLGCLLFTSYIHLGF